MYSLVKFDNGEYYVLLSKRVNIIQEKNCLIKYKNGTKYSGCLIDTCESKGELRKLQERLTLESFQSIQEEKFCHSVAKKDDRAIQLISCSTPINEETLRNNVQLSTFDSFTTNHTADGHAAQQTCSTPINNKILYNPDIQLSSIPNNNKRYYTSDINEPTENIILEKDVTQTNIVQSNSSESTVPSGATDIFNAIGDDWIIDSIENECNTNNNFDDNNHNKSDENNNENENNNKITKDPDYSLNQNSTNNTNSTHGTSQSHSNQENSSTEIYSLRDIPPLDIRNVQVPCSKNSLSKRTVKKYFCPYCRTLQTKFARHLEMKHKMEVDVQKFIHIKKGTLERAKIIATIRKHGNLLHNTHPELNTGVFITARQHQAKYKRTADDYICCTNCKGFYSKYTIRLHYSKCKTTHKKGVREITVMGRRLTGYIHTSASQVVREIVFLILRDDIVTRCIKYDELIILFGDKLCERYTSTHQHDMIRAHLRLLGRYKIAIQQINKEIDDFQSIFQPQNFNSAVSALRTAKWDSRIMWFKTPAVANTLTTLLKKCANTLKAECIKNQDYKKKQAVDDFLVLWNDEVPTVINKKAVED